jgi:hypothetical protein
MNNVGKESLLFEKLLLKTAPLIYLDDRGGPFGFENPNFEDATKLLTASG